MNEQSDKFNNKMDDQNQKMEQTRKASIAENANRFQRIEDNLKIQSERHTETVQKLKQNIQKRCDGVRIEAAEEVKKSEGKLVELVTETEELLAKKLNNSCSVVEEKALQRDKELEAGLDTVQEELTSVQREVSSLKVEILKQSTETSATVFLSRDTQGSPVKQPVSSIFTPKVSGLNPLSSSFTPARSERQFTPSMHSGQDISQNRFGRRKPPEFDGKMSLESYLAQFEDLAEMNGWSDRECAIHLSTSLKGSAVEILSHLTREERHSYSDLVGALERRFGTRYQTEVFRERFRKRRRNRGESLQELAQDLESMAYRAYPDASLDVRNILLKDQFVDSLGSERLQIQVKQSRPITLQEALARALEFESFVQSSKGETSYVPSTGFKARRGQVDNDSNQSEDNANDRPKFKGVCWYCNKPGHSKRFCRKRMADEESRIAQDRPVGQQQVSGNREKKNSANQTDVMQQENW